MKIAKLNSHSIDNPIILTNHSRELLIQNRQKNLNSDIKSLLQDNQIEKTPTAKNGKIHWESLNKLTKSKLQKNSNNNVVSINLYKIKPLSQQILSCLKPKHYRRNNNINKSANYNESCKENSHPQSLSNHSVVNPLNIADAPKVKIKLESISISNSPRMNLIRFKKLMNDISGSSYSSNRLKQKQTDVKRDNSSIINKFNMKNHLKKLTLKLTGEKFFSKHQTPKVRTIHQKNVNILNNIHKNQKEKYLQYIEGNLKESRKLYIQNNISCLRGNRQKMRFSYNPLQI